MKLLVTGANGQLGRELIQQNRDRGHGFDIAGFDSRSLDITQARAVQQAIASVRPQAVINAAAYTAVDRAEDSAESARAFAVNRDGPKLLAEACHAAAIPLLHVSTDYVFDGQQTNAYRETDPVSPLGVYGESKWLGEQAVREVLPQHLIVRTSWVFSAHGNNFVKTMLRLARSRSELRVVADQRGCPTYAGALADALLRMAAMVGPGGTVFSDDSVWGTYHFCGEPATTWHGFAEAIIATARRITSEPLAVETIVPITTADYPTPAARPANSVMGCDRLRSVFLITPPPWQTGLEQILPYIIDKTDS